MTPVKVQILNPNIDTYLNPWIPHSRIDRLPRTLRRFLGYRTEPYVEPPLVVQWSLAFLASVAGICFVGGVFNNAPGITQYHPPTLIASLGASAVLDFNAIRSPLAQPRNAVIGNTLSALCGVAISKGFQNFSDFEQIRWVSSAFGCALASLVMSMAGSVYPPGGATAVIASADSSTVAMGWIYVPLVLLASVMMQLVALLFNNTFRRYPLHWWTAEDVGSKFGGARSQDEETADGGLQIPGVSQGRLSASETDSNVASTIQWFPIADRHRRHLPFRASTSNIQANKAHRKGIGAAAATTSSHKRSDRQIE